MSSEEKKLQADKDFNTLLMIMDRNDTRLKDLMTRFSAKVISAGRITIPNDVQSKMGLKEGDSVRVGISKEGFVYPMLYKNKETDKIEMIAIGLNDPSAKNAVKEGKQIIEGKSVEWAYFNSIFGVQWVVEPEKT